jgi:hypothetical protein
MCECDQWQQRSRIAGRFQLLKLRNRIPKWPLGCSIVQVVPMNPGEPNQFTIKSSSALVRWNRTNDFKASFWRSVFEENEIFMNSLSTTDKQTRRSQQQSRLWLLTKSLRNTDWTCCAFLTRLVWGWPFTSLLASNVTTSLFRSTLNPFLFPSTGD